MATEPIIVSIVGIVASGLRIVRIAVPVFIECNNSRLHRIANWHVRSSSYAQPIVVTYRYIDFTAKFFIWLFGNEVNRAASSIPTVQRSLRAAQYFHPLCVKGSEHGSHRPSHIDAV